MDYADAVNGGYSLYTKENPPRGDGRGLLSLGVEAEQQQIFALFNSPVGTRQDIGLSTYVVIQGSKGETMLVLLGCYTNDNQTRHGSGLYM